MRVGELQVDPIIDGIGRFSPTEAFAGTGESDWAAHRDLLNPDGTVDLAYGGFLIRGAGDHIILVDAGVGDTITWHGQQFAAGMLLTNLRRAGIEPEQVTDVMLTHLHYDHVGWTTRKGAIVFPNATYRCHVADWEHFAAPGKPASRKLTPVTGRLELWDADGPVRPGVDVLHAPGHTPGSSMVVISSGAARALLIGDVVHCPVQLMAEEWAAIADVDPVQAERTRRALAVQLERKQVPVAASHFPGLAFGRLMTRGTERSWAWR